MKERLTKSARGLRNNPTEAEKQIWYMLRQRNLGVKFRRQGIIGRYIVDFVCFEKCLVIEIDGGQHMDHLSDKIRDQWLGAEGFRVLRFWNDDVLKNRDGVLQIIVGQLKSPLPNPPHKGEGTSIVRTSS